MTIIAIIKQILVPWKGGSGNFFAENSTDGLGAVYTRVNRDIRGVPSDSQSENRAGRITIEDRLNSGCGGGGSALQGWGDGVSRFQR